MRTISMVALVVGVGTGAFASQQIELDRSLQKVHGTVIMASDVRQVQWLKLLPEAGRSDQVVLTALENRLLILYEVSRVQLKEPPADAIARRRTEWRATLPADADITAIMTRSGMSEKALDGWFRDDLRISDFLDQRFGQRPPEERGRLMTEWLTLLRRRANLSGKIA